MAQYQQYYGAVMPLRLFTILVCLCFALPSAQAATQLVVYTAIEPELLPLYTKAFEEENPDISLHWVRDSAGNILAKLLAERNAPKADVVFGLSLNALMRLSDEAMLEPYITQGLEAVSPQMQDTAEEPVWTALNAWGGAMCVNTEELQRRNLPVPAAWNDLAKPKYKGAISMASPLSSSTALLNVNGWLQLWGEKKAWKFMQALNKNIASYPNHGCQPCQMAAKGEIAIGIAAETCVNVMDNKPAALQIIQPGEGIGWDFETAALLKNSAHPEEAKALIDFAVSPQAADIAIEFGFIPSLAAKQTAASKRTLSLFLPIDPEKAGAAREAILKEWGKRFGN
ncbi:extracellular solute-binding protein [Desulfovibrio cuneatus]|uniref:extracellular solute-binding protein n=1 Tax=Desulfovibrio cuneatus TaxID=159728 RepID=UPI00146F9F1C|nr:extracellular solute-binding protein [Desulfovibrio cuneatus]